MRITWCAAGITTTLGPPVDRRFSDKLVQARRIGIVRTLSGLRSKYKTSVRRIFLGCGSMSATSV